MIDKSRMKNADWKVAHEGKSLGVDHAQIAVLMDIRDELQRLNSLLHCHNFTSLPATVRTISRKMPVRRRVRP